MTAIQPGGNRIAPGAKTWLRRLNVLLRFAGVNPWKLNNGALEKLKAGMYFAVMGEGSPQEDEVFRPIFDHIATREALDQAHRGLNRALRRLLDTPTTAGPLTQFERAKFKLTGQELSIGFVRGAFAFRSHTDHFPSQVYRAFFDALQASGVKPSDILRCSHCGTVFVPLRQPRKGTAVYCSHNCASVIASRNYRARQAEMRTKARKMKGKRKTK
jgi:hypothetical protein